jgi:hypothetical protein
MLSDYVPCSPDCRNFISQSTNMGKALIRYLPEKYFTDSEKKFYKGYEIYPTQQNI